MTPTLAFNDLLQKWFFRGDSMTETVKHTDQLFMFLWWNSVFWFVLLMALTAYFVVRYRRVPGKPVAPSPHHHTVLETIWTVVPTIVLVFIFVFGFWNYMEKVVPAGDATELIVKAKMWSWSITYPDGTQSTETTQIDPNGREVPVFCVPENADFRLRMSSQDVIHSFWIPDLRTKMDVIPNRYTGYAFRTPTLDMGETQRDLWIFCAEYCGQDHSEMAGILRVVPRPAFNEWINKMKSGGDPLETGAAVWKVQCAACHTTNGTQNTGPTWKGGASYNGQTFGFGYPVHFADGSSLEARDANYVRESILDPTAKVVAGFQPVMPSFDGQLSDAQLEGVIMYYQSQSDRGPTMDTGEGASEESAPGAAPDAAPADGAADATPADGQDQQTETDQTQTPQTGGES